MIRSSLRAAATALALAAAGAAFAADKTLQVAYQSDIGSFDPDNSFEVAALGAVNAVYEGLVAYAPGTTTIVPGLAKSWTISPDGLVYTFTLRDKVVFHDGKPMTSSEVLASFNRRKSKSLILSYFLWNVKEMSAPDPSTFVLKLGMPQPSLLDTFASPWGPKVVSPGALVDQAGSDLAKSWLNTHAIGTGPFSLAEFAPGSRYVIKRNDAYWGAKPYFAGVNIAVLPDMGQQILKLRAGELDVILTGYPVAQLSKLPAGFSVASNPNFAMIIGFVNPDGALAKPELRKAVMAATNPKHWLAEAFGDTAVPAATLYPSAMLKAGKPYDMPSDMAAAKAAAATLGKPGISIAYTSDKAASVRVPIDLMIAQLAAVGIDATARALPPSEPYGFAKNRAQAPDLFVTRVNPDAAHPETQATVFFTKGGPVNVYGFSLPQADKLVMDAGMLDDRSKADPMYEEAARLMIDAGGFIPFAELRESIVYRSSLKNVVTRPSFPPGNIDFALVSE
jgi:peptide/nickel transport system substrate-binding protein